MTKPARLPHLALAVTTLSVIGMAPSAHSELLLRVDDGTTILTIADGAAQDQCSPVGCVTFSGNIGNFHINMTTGQGNPAVGSTDSPSLELKSISVTAGDAGGTLRMFLTQTDFVTFVPLNLAGNIAGVQSGSGSVAAEFFMDILNTPFGETHQIGTTLNLMDPTFNGLTSGIFNPAEWYREFGWGMYTDGAFSLTEQIDLMTGGHGNISFDASFADPPFSEEPTPVPEPTSMALLVTALFGLSLAGHRCREHRTPPLNRGDTT